MLDWAVVAGSREYWRVVGGCMGVWFGFGVLWMLGGVMGCFGCFGWWLVAMGNYARGQQIARIRSPQPQQMGK